MLIFTCGHIRFSWLRTVTTLPSLPVSPTSGGIRRRILDTYLTTVSRTCSCLWPWTYRTSPHRTAGNVFCLCLWPWTYWTLCHRTEGSVSCLCLWPWTYRTLCHHTEGSVSCLCLWPWTYRRYDLLLGKTHDIVVFHISADDK